MTEQPTTPPAEIADDALESLEPAKLAAMLRDKRRAEASLRTRLRETETERDALAEKVTGWQRRDLEASATKAGLLPEAVTDLNEHLELAEVLADDGSIDSDKLADVLRQVRTDRPHWFKQIGASTIDAVWGGERPAAPEASWSDVIGGR